MNKTEQKFLKGLEGKLHQGEVKADFANVRDTLLPKLLSGKIELEKIGEGE